MSKTSRGSPSGFTTASRVVGKEKIGELTSKLTKGMKECVMKTDETPKSVTPRSLTLSSSGHASVSA